MPLNRTYLVQRLILPSGERVKPTVAYRIETDPKKGEFIPEECSNARKGVWGLDYMGAAEFEWGAIPKALKGMVKDMRRLTVFKLPIYYNTVRLDMFVRVEDVPKAHDKFKIYGICRTMQKNEVEQRILELVTDKVPPPSEDAAQKSYEYMRPRLKEPLLFSSALLKPDEYSVRGWFELDNGFMFFIDKKMWRHTCRLFDLRTKD